MKPLNALLLWCIVLLTGCHKNVLELELPPATQQGLNTFGCRVNGAAWVPGYTKVADIDKILLFEYSIDPDYGGVFQVRANNTKTNNFNILLFSNQVNQVGIYNFHPDSSRVTLAHIVYNHCEFASHDSTTYCAGNIEFTRLDAQIGLAAGRFAFTIAKPGCDTVKVTDGRFDLKMN